ncbi:hypothetical protein BDW74DRAFT_182049 [Aspergillus multicolor]|uniref:uncharacterized protein n=1 Tax=Aspergillus multicolor TaxID=41759 RepID=UPI003CCD7779
MNGNFESSKDTQQKARQLRRHQRRQARLANTEATDESSDEASHINTGKQVPREPIDRLVAVIQFLGSYNSEVEQIERALGGLMQKDEKIQHLSTALRELQRSKNEESRTIEEEKCRLRELQSHLNNQEASLNLSLQKLEEEKQQLEEEKTKFKADEKAKYEKALAIERKKIEGEFQRKAKQNEKAVAVKLEQAAQQIQQLHSQVSDLTATKDDAERTLALFKARTRQLEDQQRELESRYKTQDSPLSEFEEILSRIHEGLRAIGHAYFGELPGEDSDIDRAQHILCSHDQIFQYVPLTTSDASKYLRVWAAESVIAKAICRTLWQPFGGPQMRLFPDQTSAFVKISEALARQDRRKESLWRYLTLEGSDIAALQATKNSTPTDQLALLETEHLYDILRVIVPEQKEKDFKCDLEHLLTDCICFWNKAKRDSCIIEFDTEPPQLCGQDWVPEPCSELDHVDINIEQGQLNVQPWCLFPRAIFRPIDEEPKVLAGSAIFSNCPAFREGLYELRRQEEEFTQFKRKFARQPSISKGQK